MEYTGRSRSRLATRARNGGANASASPVVWIAMLADERDDWQNAVMTSSGQGSRSPARCTRPTRTPSSSLQCAEHEPELGPGVPGGPGSSDWQINVRAPRSEDR